MTPEQYHKLIAECVGRSFNEMRKDLERRIAIVLSRHLPKAVVINMAQEISKTVSEEMLLNFFSSGALDRKLKELL